MSMSVLTLPAPGWYPDPAGHAVYRWWDGLGWTEGVHDGRDTETGAPMRLFADEPVAHPAPADDEFILTAETFTASAAASPVREAPVLLGPPTITEGRAAPRTASRGAPKTRWSRLLAAFPVAYPIAVGMIAALGYAGGAASNLVTLIVIAASAAVLLLIPAFVLAEQDRRELVARGVRDAPSLGWMLLLPPIAYLVARRRATAP